MATLFIRSGLGLEMGWGWWERCGLEARQTWSRGGWAPWSTLEVICRGHGPFPPTGWMASCWRWAARSRKGCQPSTAPWPYCSKSSSPQTPDTKVGTPGGAQEPLSFCPAPVNSSVLLWSRVSLPHPGSPHSHMIAQGSPGLAEPGAQTCGPSTAWREKQQV